MFASCMNRAWRQYYLFTYIHPANYNIQYILQRLFISYIQYLRSIPISNLVPVPPSPIQSRRPRSRSHHPPWRLCTALYGACVGRDCSVEIPLRMATDILRGYGINTTDIGVPGPWEVCKYPVSMYVCMYACRSQPWMYGHYHRPSWLL